MVLRVLPCTYSAGLLTRDIFPYHSTFIIAVVYYCISPIRTIVSPTVGYRPIDSLLYSQIKSPKSQVADHNSRNSTACEQKSPDS
jgi:hypothetical protein